MAIQQRMHSLVSTRLFFLNVMSIDAADNGPRLYATV